MEADITCNTETQCLHTHLFYIRENNKTNDHVISYLL